MYLEDGDGGRVLIQQERSREWSPVKVRDSLSFMASQARQGPPNRPVSSTQPVTRPPSKEDFVESRQTYLSNKWFPRDAHQ